MGRTPRRLPSLQLTQHRSILPALKWRGLASGYLMLTCLSLRHLCPSYQVLCHPKSKACVCFPNSFVSVCFPSSFVSVCFPSSFVSVCVPGSFVCVCVPGSFVSVCVPG